jgi:hypothetical protein
MANFFTKEIKSLGDTPPRQPGDEAYYGRPRIFRATIPLDTPPSSSSVNGTVVAIADTVTLAKIPPGMRWRKGVITSSVSLGTSTIAIGIAGTPAKYRAAAVFTAVDTPTIFGEALDMAADASTGEETIIMTVAVANLPTTAGARLVIDLEFVGP